MGTEPEKVSVFVEPRHFRPEVVQLAEHLERLPPGDYLVRIEKPDMKGLPWRAEIVRTDRITVVDLLR